MTSSSVCSDASFLQSTKVFFQANR